ncbi:unnamed protein product [Brassica oleracea var. botrytis]
MCRPSQTPHLTVSSARIDPLKRVLGLKEGVVTPPPIHGVIGLESSSTGSSFPADSAKPVPLAVVSLDSRQGHRIPLARTSSELAVRRPGKAPERAVPSPSPGRHEAVRYLHVSGSSSPPTVDGFGTGTPEPSPQSQSFSRSYGSILPTSLAYIVPSTRGCSHWKPDAAGYTCNGKGGGSNLSDKGVNPSGSWQQGHSATYNTPSRRADIEGSKSNVAMNAWLPQASYPCGNFSDTSSFKFRRSKGSIGHAFTMCRPSQTPHLTMSSARIDPPKRVLGLKEGVVTPPPIHGLAVRRPGKALERAVPSPSPGRHEAVRSRHISGSSSPPTVDRFGIGTPEPSPQSQSFSRSYGSILPTSLAYIVPSTRGC